MTLITLFWRLGRRRWMRRVLLWLVVRLIRLFGWRRAVRFALRGSGRSRLLLLALWRATIRRLGLARALRAVG